MTTARPEQRRQTKDHQSAEKPVRFPRDTWRLFCRRLIACLVVGGAVFTAGCAEHIATVKHISPPSPATVPADGSQLVQADQDLVQAKKIEHTEPMRALGGYLAAARIAS